MNFRELPQMFVAYPKAPLATYRDLTMPKRDWHAFDFPTSKLVQPRVNVDRVRQEKAA